jgi:hypothetical protein
LCQRVNCCEDKMPDGFIKKLYNQFLFQFVPVHKLTGRDLSESVWVHCDNTVAKASLGAPGKRVNAVVHLINIAIRKFSTENGTYEPFML